MEKRQYKPPQAKDLSGFSASGQEPMGACTAGPNPWFNCTTGPGFSAGDCVAGAMPNDVSACGPGGYHTTPTCDFGANAATVCISGANQQ